MADIEFGGVEDVPQEAMQSGKITKFVNAAGALMSVALIVGVGVWGYRLLVRDVSGVPVVQAIDGPMRVQPDDPGGELATHQGLAVNRVQSDGVAEPVADRLVLAPVGAGVGVDDPVGIQRPAPAPRDDVTPMAEAADAEVVADTSGEITAPALLTETLPPPELPETVSDGEGVAVATNDPAAAEPSATDMAVAEALAMANRIAGEAVPLTEVEEVAATAPTISADIPGITRSPRPLVRPTSLDTTPAVAPVEVVAAQVVSAPATDVDPATIASGTRLAQLGAYDSTEVAQKEWDRLNNRFAEYMEGKSRVIQEATSGGRTFYRLRAMGFDDLSDARRFCSALLAEKAACIPVKVR